MINSTKIRLIFRIKMSKKVQKLRIQNRVMLNVMVNIIMHHNWLT